MDTMNEEVPTVNGLPLRLSFSPDAIREHFEADDEEDPTLGLTDDQLLRVGEMALDSERLYWTFHEVLTRAIEEERRSMDSSARTCRHCGRRIVQVEGEGWIDPEAPIGEDAVEQGDGIWRILCDQHESFVADHEPGVYDPYGDQKHHVYEEN